MKHVLKPSRKVLLAERLNFNVTSGSTSLNATGAVIEISEFKYFIVGARSSGSHNYRVRIEPNVENNTFGRSLEYGTVIIDNPDGGGEVTDKLLAKTDLLQIHNSFSSPRLKCLSPGKAHKI
ncbi:hypothetical protein [Alkalihalobacillus sp. BA299]|uniref:hypothetical protein n=1 Tax=Alkalihalobacillus sp. BA299 TaxID=2815938 RepID=UPI001ADA2609|nr:hypothetical protein [Alkalihalobacillus sp. BA299]